MPRILFTPLTLGRITLSNRVVMSPMTRSRAIDNVPNALMAEYYGQRAGAGLIITEGTAPDANGLGYPRIPGAFTDAQTEGWKGVARAVHANGGRIFMQLMHTGRIGHPNNMSDDAELLAPSAIAAPGEMYTDQEGPKPHPTPRAMTDVEVEAAVTGFVRSAENAIKAGFDGVEIHGANGYLVDQFLHPIANQRDDRWGGTPENRNRFAVTVSKAIADAIGGDRVGIRLSPYGVYNGVAPFDGIDAQYNALAAALKKVGVAYIHLVDHSSQGAPAVPDAIKTSIREAFGGTLILSGGYDGDRAEADLEAGRGDLVAFGRPFLANPDLVDRLQIGAPLNEVRHDLFFTPGEEGLTDYPARKPVAVVVGVGPGNGEAFARRFTEGGYAVALLARSPEKLEALAAELEDARAFACDVSNTDAVNKAFQTINDEMGPVSTLLYNVGSGMWGNVEQLSPEALRAAMEINVVGLLASVQAVAPAMKTRGSGSVIVTGATASLRGGANFAGFAPAKGAQRILTQSMARHLGPLGVHVALMIVDGMIDIERPGQDNPALADVKRLQPAAIADAAWFLAHQDRSAWTFELDVRPQLEKW